VGGRGAYAREKSAGNRAATVALALRQVKEQWGKPVIGGTSTSAVSRNAVASPVWPLSGWRFIRP